MVTCPKCEGNKVLSITPQMFENGKFVSLKTVVIDCVFCNGKGKVSKALIRAEENFWCKCGNPSGESTFHDEGEGPEISKHHYRCNDCHKVTQVG